MLLFKIYQVFSYFLNKLVFIIITEFFNLGPSGIPFIDSSNQSITIESKNTNSVSSNIDFILKNSLKLNDVNKQVSGFKFN